MAFSALAGQLLLLIASVAVVAGGRTNNWPLQFLWEHPNDAAGTRWAVLIATSNGYGNYRHQADVCHAYQILKKGGLKDENIVVFMYDDIASSPKNPRPGVIINSPAGPDVYAGVPKDYTGKDVTVNNFLSALVGNKENIKGGSGKVVNSGPNDHIFVYSSGHGAPGLLVMPSEEYLFANQLVETLKAMYAQRRYRSLVFYIEACESGSMFEGLLPEGISVYATTASNALYNSWATYCPPNGGFTTCLGDLYSVNWMYNTEVNDRRTVSLKQQYNVVKARTTRSPVMKYGDLKLDFQMLDMYMGAATRFGSTLNNLSSTASAVTQRDADLLYMWHEYQKSAEGSSEKSEARKQLMEELASRSHVDSSVEMIVGGLFSSEEGPKVLRAFRSARQPLVDDWDCLKSMVRSFEEQCGKLGQYGIKHTKAFANMCNAGVGPETMSKLASHACSTFEY